MDLRSYGISDVHRAKFLEFIEQRKLSYQPFIFDEDRAVGEGLAFLNSDSIKTKKAVVDWLDAPGSISDIMVSPSLREAFREANADLAAIYDHFVDFIRIGLGGSVEGLSFAEFGCNTGYFMYGLDKLGAGRTVGLDFTNNAEVFETFNDILGTSSEFMFSEWDSYRHCAHYNDVPEVDVALSIAVLCHLADPLFHLSYLCSKARKAVFVWTPAELTDDLYMSFGKPALFDNSLAWPVSFDNMVKPTRGLIELCLRECGFGEIFHIEGFPSAFDKIGFWQHHAGILALRTEEAKTVYTGGMVRRDQPGDVGIKCVRRSSQFSLC